VTPAFFRRPTRPTGPDASPRCRSSFFYLRVFSSASVSALGKIGRGASRRWPGPAVLFFNVALLPALAFLLVLVRWSCRRFFPFRSPLTPRDWVGGSSFLVPRGLFPRLGFLLVLTRPPFPYVFFPWFSHWLSPRGGGNPFRVSIGAFFPPPPGASCNVVGVGSLWGWPLHVGGPSFFFTRYQVQFHFPPPQVRRNVAPSLVILFF